MKGDLKVRKAPDGALLVPGRNGGFLRRGGPGPKPSKTSMLRRVARHRIREYLELADQIARDEAASVDDRIKAMTFALKVSGLEKERPAPQKPATFGVVSKTPAEFSAMTAKNERRRDIDPKGGR